MPKKKAGPGPLLPNSLTPVQDSALQIDSQGNLKVHEILLTRGGLHGNVLEASALDCSTWGESTANDNNSTDTNSVDFVAFWAAKENSEQTVCGAPQGWECVGTSTTGKPVLAYSLAPTTETTGRMKYEDFKYMGCIGDGSTGKVNLVAYMLEEKTPDGQKRKALKFAEKVIALNSPDMADTIYRELIVIKNRGLIACPYIVQSYEAFFVDGDVHIIMEAMDMSLFHVLRKLAPRRTLPHNVLVAVLQQVVEALVYLHTSGPSYVLHRDIKPGNILVNKKKGTVKLADFGCLKAAVAPNAHVSTFVGTKIYMSPERIRGENYSTSADIWSLGLVAYECAFGRFAFRISDPSSFAEVWNAVEGPTEPMPSNANVHLVDFLNQCLQQSPSLRPSAKDLQSHPLLSSSTYKLNEAGRVVYTWLKSLESHS